MVNKIHKCDAERYKSHVKVMEYNYISLIGIIFTPALQIFLFKLKPHRPAMKCQQKEKTKTLIKIGLKIPVFLKLRIIMIYSPSPEFFLFPT